MRASASMTVYQKDSSHHIPYTFNAKKVESAITNIINNRPVTNRDALINPESLDYFERILPDIQR